MRVNRVVVIAEDTHGLETVGSALDRLGSGNSKDLKMKMDGQGGSMAIYSPFSAEATGAAPVMIVSSKCNLGNAVERKPLFIRKRPKTIWPQTKIASRAQGVRF